MSAENVYGALGLTRPHSLLGYDTGYARSDDGYGTNRPLPRHETSFDAEPEHYGLDVIRDQSSDLRAWSSETDNRRVEFQAFLYETAISDPRAEVQVFLSDVSQLYQAFETMQAEGRGLTGNTPDELFALAEQMQIAHPDANEEEIVERLGNAIAFIEDWRQARLVDEIEAYLKTTATTDSRPAAEQHLESRA